MPEIRLYGEGGEWEVVQLGGRPSARGAHEALDVGAHVMAAAIEATAISRLPKADQPKVTSLTEYRIRRNGRVIEDDKKA